MILCPEGQFEELLAATRADAPDKIAQADRLIAQYGGDPRLHLLRGSMLAGIGRPIEALSSLKRAVEIAPDFAIARFQLGFFYLTSGEPGEALSAWGPIALLPDGHYLRFFVGGLTHLIRDEFDDTIARLQQGIAANSENPPLNVEMEDLIEKVRAVQMSNRAAEVTGGDKEKGSASATSFLLDQITTRRAN